MEQQNFADMASNLIQALVILDRGLRIIETLARWMAGAWRRLRARRRRAAP